MTNPVELIGIAVKNNLKGVDFLLSLPQEKVAECYNGIGSDSMPEMICNGLTKHFPEWEAAALIHDCRFAFCEDRSTEAFVAANAEFKANCIIMSRARFGWYHPMRYIREWDAGQAENLLNDFGWDAWKNANS